MRVAVNAKVWHDHHDGGYAVRLLNATRLRQQAAARVLLRRRHRDTFGSIAKFFLVTFPISRDTSWVGSGVPVTSSSGLGPVSEERRRAYGHGCSTQWTSTR